jgi:hypothetical protein
VSLINEALKRAEAERQGRPVTTPPMPEPVENAENAVPQHVAATKLGHSPLLAGLLIVALLAVGGWYGYTSWLGGPQQAGGAAEESAAAPAAVPAADAETPAAKTLPAAKAAKSASVAAAAAPQAVAQAPALAEDPEDDPEVALLAALTEPAAEKAPVAAPPAAIQAPAAVPPAKPQSPTLDIKPKAAPRLFVEPAANDLSQYKITTIMASPTGARAVINGRVVGVGQMIDKARVVAISPQEVELEIDGRRAKIGL